MPLMPKRVKYRKSQKGRVKGNATRGNFVAFGEYGIQTLEKGRISAQTIEAGRIVASQSIKGGGKLYIRIFPHKSITSIPAETRMGKGKGEVEYWAAIVKPGTVLFELAGVSEEVARATFARLSWRTSAFSRRASSPASASGNRWNSHSATTSPSTRSPTNSSRS